MGLQAGERAPEVTLPSHENQQTALSSLWADGPAVLFFFPLAFSSTCTEELCSLRDDWQAYAALRARVAAISVDFEDTLTAARVETIVATIEGKVRQAHPEVVLVLITPQPVKAFGLAPSEEEA